MFGKIIIWSLIISCFLSFGSGYGRAVICSNQPGEVELSMSHGGDNGHCCPAAHLHGQYDHDRQQPQSGSLSLSAKHNSCAGCNDFEISLQLFAPCREQVKAAVKLIAKPLLTPTISTPQLFPTGILSHPPALPPIKDPFSSHLKNVLLLI